MNGTKKKIKLNGWDILIGAILIIFTALSIYPFIYTIVGSFNDGVDFTTGGVWIWPRKFTTANYKAIIEDARMYTAFFNTVTTTVLGVVGGLTVTSCVAYAMSQKALKFKKFFWTVNMITMFFSGGLIPYYMMTLFTGLYDTYLVYVIPTLYSVYNMIIMTGFFKSIDPAMRESALIDGASEYRIWLTLYLPVSKPALATVGLWIAVARWNSYMSTMIYTRCDEKLWLLQYYLMKLIRDMDMPSMDASISQQISSKTVSFAAIVISTIPIICVYPFIAKHFNKGIMVGAVKG